MINRNSRCRSGSPAMRRHSRCNQRSLGNLRNQPNQLNLHGSRNPAKRKVAAADKAGLAMVFTGMRHFRH